MASARKTDAAGLFALRDPVVASFLRENFRPIKTQTLSEVWCLAAIPSCCQIAAGLFALRDMRGVMCALKCQAHKVAGIECGMQFDCASVLLTMIRIHTATSSPQD